ncbi:beta-lactamase family protein [Alteromonas pelagimontana]|uniref:Beta-lactamase family protein n=1 Tax=Alteromonas pelagimontana TaxID=1858656 RepID=A0A6M4MD08_9ALTE|nr:serine hydrolase domain-containing protein [Alteromonas pelagimontana]QJR81071.1 beta-lactamase family protein [Alteromonas pelagimontana]
MMFRKLAIGVATLLSVSLASCATIAPNPNDENVSDFSQLESRLDTLVTEGVMPGSVTYIIENGEVVFHHINGYQDIQSNTPMQEKTLFRLYSMSKPITSVAIMMLHEEGKLSVDDPVSKYLPAFGDVKVYQSGPVDDMTLVNPDRPMTIGDLLAHKSGITYHFTGETPVHQYYRKHGVKRDTPVGTRPTDGPPAKNLAELTERLAQAPLLHQPGEKFSYSYSTTLLGQIIEVVSNERLDKYLEKHLFAPLGMKDTGFFVTGEDLDRFVTNYLMTENGLKVIETRNNTDYKDMSRLLDGGGALAGTAQDYLAFATMLANKGKYNGKQIIPAKAVDQLFAPQITIEDFGNDAPIDFGYGFAIGSPQTENINFMPAGTYGWAGSGNTLFWVNPQTHSVVLFMTQVITPPPFHKQVPFREYLIDATTE